MKNQTTPDSSPTIEREREIERQIQTVQIFCWFLGIQLETWQALTPKSEWKQLTPLLWPFRPLHFHSSCHCCVSGLGCGQEIQSKSYGNVELHDYMHHPESCLDFSLGFKGNYSLEDEWYCCGQDRIESDFPSKADWIQSYPLIHPNNIFPKRSSFQAPQIISECESLTIPTVVLNFLQNSAHFKQKSEGGSMTQAQAHPYQFLFTHCTGRDMADLFSESIGKRIRTQCWVLEDIVRLLHRPHRWSWLHPTCPGGSQSH